MSLLGGQGPLPPRHARLATHHTQPAQRTQGTFNFLYVAHHPHRAHPKPVNTTGPPPIPIYYPCRQETFNQRTSAAGDKGMGSGYLQQVAGNLPLPLHSGPLLCTHWRASAPAVPCNVWLPNLCASHPLVRQHIRGLALSAATAMSSRQSFCFVREALQPRHTVYTKLPAS